MEGGVTPPEVSAPSEFYTMGEEKSIGLDSIVVRDDDHLTKVLPEMFKGHDSPFVLR
jgi:hypothetical protein